jgi:hypothetical protein
MLYSHYLSINSTSQLPKYLIFYDDRSYCLLGLVALAFRLQCPTHAWFFYVTCSFAAASAAFHCRLVIFYCKCAFMHSVQVVKSTCFIFNYFSVVWGVWCGSFIPDYFVFDIFRCRLPCTSRSEPHFDGLN